MRSRQISLIWSITVLLLFLIGNVLVILSIAGKPGVPYAVTILGRAT